MRSSSAKTGACTRAFARAHCFDFIPQSLFFSSFYAVVLFDVMCVSFCFSSQ